MVRAGMTVARAAVGMGAATAVSRLIGSVRVLVIAAVLGPTYLGNTFQGANSFSTVLFELLAAGALSAVLVPTFVRLFDRADTEGVERVAGGLLGLSLVAMAVVSLAGVLAAPWLARFLTGAVDDQEAAAGSRDLATFLLRFFIPQVLLYAWGAVATAILHARRSYAVAAAAPIGNTVVIVVALVVFRAMAGPDAGLDLSGGERLVLALGGTLGVAAFVGAPVMALRLSGFRLWPRWTRDDPEVATLLRLSGWAALQHSAAAILLLAAIVVGGAVEGGVVAYQVAFVAFLAPYAILAQPVHTAILPELALEAGAGDPTAFQASLRWALDAMAVALVPVSAACLALSIPLVRLVAYGRMGSAKGVELMAAALASLAIGLFAYGAFLLLARAWYALGDSRTPAVTALLTALVGAAIMVGAAQVSSGTALVFALGAGHSVAFLLGAAVLAIGLRRRTGTLVSAPSLVRVLAVSAVLGLAAWVAMGLWDPAGRLGSAVALSVVLGVATIVYLASVRVLRPVPVPVA